MNLLDRYLNQINENKSSENFTYPKDLFVTITYPNIRMPQDLWNDYMHDPHKNQQRVLTYLNLNHLKESRTKLDFEDLDNE
jgi:hypothetical protein